MTGDDAFIIGRYLARGLIEEGAAEGEPIRVVPLLLRVGGEPHAAEVAVWIGLVELVGDLGQAVPGDRTIGDVELGGIDPGLLQHADVVEERARVGVEGEGEGGALECRLGPGEGNVTRKVAARTR